MAQHRRHHYSCFLDFKVGKCRFSLIMLLLMYLYIKDESLNISSICDFAVHLSGEIRASEAPTIAFVQLLGATSSTILLPDEVNVGRLDLVLN
jgi:hypothetical protein